MANWHNGGGWIHLGELGMYIINPKSIIYMDPIRHKDKPLPSIRGCPILGHPRMCEEATHRQGDRDKLSNQSDSLQPPGGAAWGKRHNVITFSPQKGTNQHTRMPQNEASSQGSVRDQIATEQGTSKATTATQGHGLTSHTCAKFLSS
jgi:hypothetical protein